MGRIIGHLVESLDGEIFQMSKPKLYSHVLMNFPLTMAALARVSEKGIEKHGDVKGWKSTTLPEDHYNALLRHLCASYNVPDTESGELHALHVAWRALAAAELVLMKEKKNA